jgi:hypothetical protein
MRYDSATLEDLTSELFYAGHPYLLPHNVKAFRARYHGGVAQLTDDSGEIGAPGASASPRMYFTVESVQYWDGSRIYRVLRVAVGAYHCPTCECASGRTSAVVHRNLISGADNVLYPSAKAARAAINRHIAAALGEAPAFKGQELEYV